MASKKPESYFHNATSQKRLNFKFKLYLSVAMFYFVFSFHKVKFIICKINLVCLTQTVLRLFHLFLRSNVHWEKCNIKLGWLRQKLIYYIRHANPFSILLIKIKTEGIAGSPIGTGADKSRGWAFITMNTN